MSIPTLRRIFRLPPTNAQRARAEIDEEIAFHLAERIDDLLARGSSREDATRHAHAEFGDVQDARASLADDAVRDACATQRRLHLAEVHDDLKHAARALRRAPAFALVIVVTFALGLGANAAMIDLLDRLLRRAPAGVADADRVVRVYGRNGWTALTRSWPDYLDLAGSADRPGVRLLERVAASRTSRREVRAPNGSSGLGEVGVASVTASYFVTLGVRVARGRTFADDEIAGVGQASAPVAVISDHLRERVRNGGGCGARVDPDAAHASGDRSGRVDAALCTLSCAAKFAFARPMGFDPRGRCAAERGCSPARHASIWRWASVRSTNHAPFKHSSRSRPLNDSMYAFSTGRPGG